MPFKFFYKNSSGRHTKNPTTFGQKIILIAFGLALLVATEVFLRLVDVFPAYRIDDPFLGFQGSRPLFVLSQSQGKSVYITNPQKLEFFNPQQFLAEKRTDIFRLFCLGGSTTYGRPFQAATAFPAWLQMMLDRVEPERSHEVVNAGGISYASYRIVRLMQEMVNYQPDLFVIYTGHNEFLETITYANLLNQPRIIKSVVHTLDKTRLYRLLRVVVTSLRRKIKPAKKGLPAEVEANLDRIAGFELYKRDKVLRRRILDQFRANINRMIDISREAHVPILFIKPMSNLSDFSPFKSESTPGIDSLTARKAARLRVRATDAMQGHDCPRARSILDQAVALDSEFAMTHYLRGQCLEQLGQIDAAFNEYQKAIDLDVCPLRAVSEIDTILEKVTQRRNVPLVLVDSVFTAHCNNGLLGKEMFVDHVHPTIKGHQFIARAVLNCLSALGMIKSSQFLSDKDLQSLYQGVLAKLDATYFATANLNLGKVLTWSRKHAEALRPLQMAAEALPQNIEAQKLLANTYHRLHQYDNALAAYHRVLALSQDDAQTWDNIADVEFRLGHLDRAIGAGKRALALDQSRVQYYMTLAEAYYKKGRLDSALVLYQQAIRIDSTDANLQNNFGRIQFHLGDISAAMQSFRRAILLDPNFALAYKNLANCFSARGQYDLASAAYRRATVLSPLDVELQNALGVACLRNGKSASAIQAFLHAVHLDSTFARGYQNLGTAYTLSGRPDSGLYYYEQALSHYAQDDSESAVATLIGIGNAAVMIGDMTRAVSVWQKCLQLSPQNVPVLFDLALALIQQNKIDAAIKYLDKARLLQPDDPKILMALADALSRANRREKARIYYDQAKRKTSLRP